MITTDYEYAFFSNLVYSSKQEQQEILERESSMSGWKLYEFIASPFQVKGLSCFAATAYLNREKRQIVIAFRGTVLPSIKEINKDELLESFANIVTDLKGIVSSLITSEQIESVNFVKNVLNKLKNDEIDIGIIDSDCRNYKAILSKYQLSFTGHSLGAWLAEITALHCNVHAITFESPGSLPMFKVMSNSNIKATRIGFAVQYSKICTYLTAPNLVNTCNSHGGEVRRIYVNLLDDCQNSDFYHQSVLKKITNFVKDPIYFSQQIWKTCLAPWLLHTLNQHSMQAILNVFDKSTGLPIEYKLVEAWPRITWLKLLNSEISDPIKVIKTISSTINIFYEYRTFHKFVKGSQIIEPNIANLEQNDMYTLRYKTKYFVAECQPREIFIDRFSPHMKDILILHKKYGTDVRFCSVRDELILQESILQYLKGYEVKGHPDYEKIPLKIALTEKIPSHLTAYDFFIKITELFATNPNLVTTLEEIRKDKYLEKAEQQKELKLLRTDLKATQDMLKVLESKMDKLSFNVDPSEVAAQLQTEQEKLRLLIETQKLKLKMRYQQLAVMKSLANPDEIYPIDERYVHVKLTLEKASLLSELSNEKNLAQKTANDEILLENLFIKEKENKKVLILGKAGIGKTTLCQYIIDHWAKNFLWDKFDWVFYISLRRLYRYSLIDLQRISLEEIIYQTCFSESGVSYDEYRKIWREIIRQKWPVLLILDGLDEIDISLANILLQLLEDRLPESFSLLMTSRPQRIHIKFDVRLETVGFTLDDIHTYIDKYFFDLTSSKGLHSVLSCNPTLLEMAHIPINLELICLLWEREVLKNDQPYLVMTDLYHLIIEHFTERYIIKTNSNKNHAREIEASLCALAFHATAARKIVLNENYVERYLKSQVKVRDLLAIGLIRKVNDSSSFQQQSHCFLHLTFQEYFAAQYLVNNLEVKNGHTDVINFIQEHKFNPQLSIVWLFILAK